MKRVWKLCVRDDEGFDRRQGYALAETESEARSLAGDPPGLVIFTKPAAMIWPGSEGEAISWSN